MQQFAIKKHFLCELAIKRPIDAASAIIITSVCRGYYC